MDEPNARLGVQVIFWLLHVVYLLSFLRKESGIQLLAAFKKRRTALSVC